MAMGNCMKLNRERKSDDLMDSGTITTIIIDRTDS